MASRIEKSIAGKVLKMHKNRPAGENGHIRAAARRILKNRGTEQDIELCRRFLGIRKSGAGAARGAMRAYKRIEGQVFSLSQDFELIRASQDRGESTAVPMARLMQNLNFQIQSAIKTKWARNAAERAAEFFGKNPAVASRALKALGRGLRLGGAIGTAALLGITAAETFFRQRGETAKSKARSLDLSRALKIDPRLSRDIRVNVEESEAENRSYLRSLLHSLGYTESEQKEIEGRQKTQKETLAKARAIAAELGIDVGAVLGKKARALGKPINELTEREKNEALDAQIRPKLDPKNFLNDERVQKELSYRLDPRRQGEGAVAAFNKFSMYTRRGAQLIAGDMLGFTETFEQSTNKLRNKLAEQRAAEFVQYLEQRVKDRMEQEQQKEEKRDPVKNFRREDALLNARMSFRAIKRRRIGAWPND